MVISERGYWSLPHLPLSPAHCLFLLMSSSLPNVAAPLIVFGDQPEGSQVPVIPNREFKQGAFCIINPDFWGAGDCQVFNGTMNYTEVCFVSDSFLTLTVLTLTS